MEENLHETIQRLEDWLDEHDIKRADFLRVADISSQRYNNWRQRGIPIREIDQIARAAGLNERYLRYGELPIKSAAGTVEMNVGDSLGTYNIMEDDVFSEMTGLVPVISWVRAGEFCEAQDPLEPGDAEDWLPRPKGASKNTYALTVKGDSMTSPYPGSRSYPQGIIIFVDPEKEVLPGNRGIFKLPESNEVTFKELVSDAGQLYLKPLNPQYDKIAVTERMTTCGKVIGSFFAE